MNFSSTKTEKNRAPWQIISDEWSLQKEWRRRNLRKDGLTHINVPPRIVLHQLAGDVLAGFARSRWHLSVILPVTAWCMRIEGSRGGMGNPGVGHDARRLSCNRIPVFKLWFYASSETASIYRCKSRSGEPRGRPRLGQRASRMELWPSWGYYLIPQYSRHFGCRKEISFTLRCWWFRSKATVSIMDFQIGSVLCYFID